MIETGVAHLAGTHLMAVIPDLTLGCEFYMANFYLGRIFWRCDSRSKTGRSWSPKLRASASMSIQICLANTGFSSCLLKCSFVLTYWTGDAFSNHYIMGCHRAGATEE
jgi:hypothetical protein